MNRYFVTNYAIDLSKDSLSIGTVKDVDVINQSIENIIFTVPGERVFMPDFGSPLVAVPFKNFNNVNGEQLLDNLISTILRWEKRININSNACRLIINPSQNSLGIKIAYSVKQDGLIGEFTKVVQM